MIDCDYALQKARCRLDALYGVLASVDVLRARAADMGRKHPDLDEVSRLARERLVDLAEDTLLPSISALRSDIERYEEERSRV